MRNFNNIMQFVVVNRWPTKRYKKERAPKKRRPGSNSKTHHHHRTTSRGYCQWGWWSFRRRIDGSGTEFSNQSLTGNGQIIMIPHNSLWSWTISQGYPAPPPLPPPALSSKGSGWAAAAPLGAGWIHREERTDDQNSEWRCLGWCCGR